MSGRSGRRSAGPIVLGGFLRGSNPVDARPVEHTRPPHEAMYSIALGQQIFREVRAILAGDACDKCTSPSVGNCGFNAGTVCDECHELLVRNAIAENHPHDGQPENAYV